MQIHKSKDYRVNIVANLIHSLKDAKYRISSFELAEQVVALMDKIQGIEYAHKINDFKEEARKFHKV
jgi:hypothetical protein